MKFILFFVAILVIAGGVYLFHPWFTQKKVNETVEDIAPASPVTPVPSVDNGGQVGEAPAIRTLMSGSFEGITVHQAKGAVTLIQSGEEEYVRFEEDFEITNGPDLLVYLGKDGKYDPTASLGDLKGTKGGQNYLIPKTIDRKSYNEVWVWCRKFSVGFGRAVLQ